MPRARVWQWQGRDDTLCGKITKPAARAGHSVKMFGQILKLIFRPGCMPVHLSCPIPHQMHLITAKPYGFGPDAQKSAHIYNHFHSGPCAMQM
jgi:hypothetical protein